MADNTSPLGLTAADLAPSISNVSPLGLTIQDFKGPSSEDAQRSKASSTIAPSMAADDAYTRMEQHYKDNPVGPSTFQKVDQTLQDVTNAGIQPLTDTVKDLPRVSENAIQGVGQGLYNAGRGAQQGIMRVANLTGMTDDQKVAALTQDITTERQKQEQDNPEGATGRWVGETLPWLSVPLSGGSGIAAKISTGALTGGTLGGLQYSPTVSDWHRNIAVGTVLGITGGTLNKLSDWVQQGVNGAKAIDYAANPDKLKSAVDDMIDKKIDPADVPKIMGQSLENTKNTLNATKNQLYNNLIQEAQRVNAGPVALDNYSLSLNQIQSQLNAKGANLSEDEKTFLTTLLPKYQQGLQDLKGSVEPTQLNDTLRKMINSDIYTVGNKDTVALGNRLIGSLDSDLTNWGMENGSNVASTLKNVNQFMTQKYYPFFQNKLIAPFADGDLAKNPQFLDNIFNKFVSESKPGAATVFADKDATAGFAPDIGTKQAVASKILGDAFNSAKTNNGWSAQKFMNNIYEDQGWDSISSTYKQYLSADQQTRLNGFANAMQMMFKPQDATMGNLLKHIPGGNLALGLKDTVGLKMAAIMLNAPVLKQVMKGLASVPLNSPAAQRFMAAGVTQLLKTPTAPGEGQVYSVTPTAPLNSSAENDDEDVE